MPTHLLLGTRKGFFELAPTADDSWSIAQTAFLGDPVTLAYQCPVSGHTYAALNHGHFGVKLHRRDAGSTEWAEITCPAYPPFPEGREPDRCPFRGIEIPWKLELIWAFASGGNDQPGRIWIGSIPGGLFKSDDHGESWTFIDSLWNHPDRAKWVGGGYDFPGIHSIVVDPRNSQRVVVAVSCGGIWETTDDGASWSLIGKGQRAEYMPPDQAFNPLTQDPHLLSACAAHPDSCWVQHHNGIFRSTDGAKNFTEITEAGPSVFGFAVAAHPQNPDTAYFVPAIKDEQRIPKDGKLVVTRTRDGGKTFDVLTEGLPQEHAYDLVYRHALDIDATGKHLAFGSTTGSLWTSSNEGDTWTQVSSNLPPINSVQFTI